MGLYDPHRLLTPLKRTNPEKGLGVDPGWVPTSWDEALDILQGELTKIRKEDPRKLTLATFSGDRDKGSYVVDDVECRPTFQLLKEHVRKYTPEMAAEITTIPATTIRRAAEEFGKEARIGSTIVVDGKELPYRPVAINIYLGAGAHKHGVATALAVQVLNQIVGNFYAPGGHRGMNIVGPSWSWEPGQTDGLVKPPQGHVREGANYYDFEVNTPYRQDLKELFPIGTNWSPMNLSTL